MSDAFDSLPHAMHFYIAERIERLDEERRALATQNKDICLEAKAAGMDIKGLRKFIARRRAEHARIAVEVCDFLATPRGKRVERCCTIAKARGGKWLGDTMKKLGITNSMSAWTDSEQSAFLKADRP